MQNWLTGIDLGGTKTEVILLDDQSNEHFHKRVATPRRRLPGHPAHHPRPGTTSRSHRRSRAKPPHRIRCLSGTGLSLTHKLRTGQQLPARLPGAAWLANT